MVLLAGLVALTGCEEEEGSLKVAATSGKTAKLDGTWIQACLATGPDSTRNVLVADGDTATTTNELFAGRTDCSGFPDQLMTIEFKIDTHGEKSMTWTGGTPPGSLPTTVTATRVESQIKSDPSLVFQDALLVDDGAADDVLYSGDHTGPVDAQGYPERLDPAAGQTRQ